MFARNPDFCSAICRESSARASSSAVESDHSPVGLRELGVDDRQLLALPLHLGQRLEELAVLRPELLERVHRRRAGELGRDRPHALGQRTPLNRQVLPQTDPGASAGLGRDVEDIHQVACPEQPDAEPPRGTVPSGPDVVEVWNARTPIGDLEPHPRGLSVLEGDLAPPFPRVDQRVPGDLRDGRRQADPVGWRQIEGAPDVPCPLPAGHHVRLAGDDQGDETGSGHHVVPWKRTASTVASSRGRA
jgi:hypothetical protein